MSEVGVGPLVSLVRELGPVAGAVVVAIVFLGYLRWYVQQQTATLDLFRATCATLVAQQDAARAAFVVEMRNLVNELRTKP